MTIRFAAIAGGPRIICIMPPICLARRPGERVAAGFRMDWRCGIFIQFAPAA
jgi:hypothetical protein